MEHYERLLLTNKARAADRLDQDGNYFAGLSRT
jgi:hypothetical protein